MKKDNIFPSKQLQQKNKRNKGQCGMETHREKKQKKSGSFFSENLRGRQRTSEIKDVAVWINGIRNKIKREKIMYIINEK